MQLDTDDTYVVTLDGKQRDWYYSREARFRVITDYILPFSVLREIAKQDSEREHYYERRIHTWYYWIPAWKQFILIIDTNTHGGLAQIIRCDNFKSLHDYHFDGEAILIYERKGWEP